VVVWWRFIHFAWSKEIVTVGAAMTKRDGGMMSYSLENKEKRKEKGEKKGAQTQHTENTTSSQDFGSYGGQSIQKNYTIKYQIEETGERRIVKRARQKTQRKFTKHKLVVWWCGYLSHFLSLLFVSHNLPFECFACMRVLFIIYIIVVIFFYFIRLINVLV
jgi:hypothetical protein